MNKLTKKQIKDISTRITNNELLDIRVEISLICFFVSLFIRIL